MRFESDNGSSLIPLLWSSFHIFILVGAQSEFIQLHPNAYRFYRASELPEEQPLRGLQHL